MPLDPRTPVLVGAADATQRFDDPGLAQEPIGLMVDACLAAERDAGARGLLRDAELVVVPRGSWSYADAAGLLARRIGAPSAHTVVAELGVLQTSLVARAAGAIARGDLDVAIVAGGEARWRAHRSEVTGIPAPLTVDAGAPDEVWAPDGMIISGEEIASGLVTAVSHYALIENARRHRDGLDLDSHARGIAGRWAAFNTVAQGNPRAWNRTPMTADEIRLPGPGNRPMAYPYNKWHNSQWNVDQAAALVLCSVAAARDHGVAPDRWVFPHAISESNVMVPVTARADVAGCAGFARAGAAAFGLAGRTADEIAHVDLYSCFPIAVQTQADELGVGAPVPTVTGGMTFAGGPLNNYVLQALVTMVGVLRAEPAEAGLVTAVSGMLTKQGVSVWGASPPPGGFGFADVSAEVDRATGRRAVVEDGAGQATVVTYTAFGERALIVADRPDGTRAIAVRDDPALAASLRAEEWCGREVHLDRDGGFAA